MDTFIKYLKDTSLLIEKNYEEEKYEENQEIMDNLIDYPAKINRIVKEINKKYKTYKPIICLNCKKGKKRTSYYGNGSHGDKTCDDCKTLLKKKKKEAKPKPPPPLKKKKKLKLKDIIKEIEDCEDFYELQKWILDEGCDKHKFKRLYYDVMDKVKEHYKKIDDTRYKTFAGLIEDLRNNYNMDKTKHFNNFRNIIKFVVNKRKSPT